MTATQQPTQACWRAGRVRRRRCVAAAAAKVRKAGYRKFRCLHTVPGPRDGRGDGTGAFAPGLDRPDLRHRRCVRPPCCCSGTPTVRLPAGAVSGKPYFRLASVPGGHFRGHGRRQCVRRDHRHAGAERLAAVASSVVWPARCFPEPWTTGSFCSSRRTTRNLITAQTRSLLVGDRRPVDRVGRGDKTVA